MGVLILRLSMSNFNVLSNFVFRKQIGFFLVGIKLILKKKAYVKIKIIGEYKHFQFGASLIEVNNDFEIQVTKAVSFNIFHSRLC